LLELFENCRLCPRECGVNRLKDGREALAGFCRETWRLRVGYVGPHFGEEPPITGTRGSGTVFFAGCSLRCSFCQNHQISRDGLGRIISDDELFERVCEMVQSHHVHNINLVTPDHFFPHAFNLVARLRERGYDLPIVYNLSGYQSKELLHKAEKYADIYLPDFKYADARLAGRFSKCRDYPEVALTAISEMVRQKGFLDTFEDEAPLAKKGVLVRHLILPGHVENSLDALTALFLEFGSFLPLSLMSQYTPVSPQEDQAMNRPLTREAFDRVYAHALDLGFENLFVQFPEEGQAALPHETPFLPDFRQEQPFSGPPPLTTPLPKD